MMPTHFATTGKDATPPRSLWAKGLDCITKSMEALPPEGLPLVLAGAVFVAEGAVMLILPALPPMAAWARALVDSSILLLFLSPVYFLVHRPFWRERRRQEDQLHHLSRQLLNAAESERQRIARDLHDEIGQSLTALQFGVATLEKSAPASAEELSEHCQRLSKTIENLGNHVRQVTSLLRPALLDDLGLVPAIRWLIEQSQGSFPALAIDFETLGCDRRLDPEVEIALYRICQECLNNVVRHAGASRVTISFLCSRTSIALTVQDNGRGFSVKKAGDGTLAVSGIGLIGMRERMAALGGYLDIRSQPGAGTEIEAVLPVKEKME